MVPVRAAPNVLQYILRKTEQMPMKRLLVILIAATALGTGEGLAQKRSLFRLPSLDGRTVDLTQYRGRVVVLSFGATWCPPCREELPVLQKVADQYAGRPVAFFWVSIDEPEVSNQHLRQFIARLGVRLPVLRDPEASILQEFKTDGVPALLILDPNWEPIGPPHVGFSDPESYANEVIKTVNALLKP